MYKNSKIFIGGKPIKARQVLDAVRQSLPALNAGFSRIVHDFSAN